MLDAVCTRPPDKFSWTSLEGRTIIREILEERITQWTNGPRPAQLDCWSQSLAGRPTILIASTGWGKTTAFFVPILVLQHLVNHPKPRIPRPPSSPVALVVTPLIELGNAHASEISDFGLTAISLTAESLQAAMKVGRNLLKEVCEGRWSVVLLSAERLVSPDVDSILRNQSFRQNLVTKYQLFGVVFHLTLLLSLSARQFPPAKNSVRSAQR